MKSFVILISLLFVSLSGGQELNGVQKVDCLFSSNMDRALSPVSLQADFEAFQMEIQSCVYKDIEVSGADQVGLCLKLFRSGIDQAQASELQVDFITGIMGIYKTEKSFNVELNKNEIKVLNLEAVVLNKISLKSECFLN